MNKQKLDQGIKDLSVYLHTKYNEKGCSTNLDFFYDITNWVFEEILDTQSYCNKLNKELAKVGLNFNNRCFVIQSLDEAKEYDNLLINKRIPELVQIIKECFEQNGSFTNFYTHRYENRKQFDEILDTKRKYYNRLKKALVEHGLTLVRGQVCTLEDAERDSKRLQKKRADKAKSERNMKTVDAFINMFQRRGIPLHIDHRRDVKIQQKLFDFLEELDILSVIDNELILDELKDN